MSLTPGAQHILIVLLFAHALLDHCFPPHETETPPLALSVGLGLLTALSFGGLIGLIAGLIVGTGYAGIRWLQSEWRHPSWFHYLSTQAAGLALLVIVVGSLTHPDSGRWLHPLAGAPLKLIAVLTGLLVVWSMGGRAVGLFVAELEFDPGSGLPNAGALIGRLERVLILFLVLAGVPSGIGLLIAAKSILRFGEVKDADNREMAEYVLIGTLASFAFAIPVAYATAVLMSWA